MEISLPLRGKRREAMLLFSGGATYWLLDWFRRKDNVKLSGRLKVKLSVRLRKVFNCPKFNRYRQYHP